MNVFILSLLMISSQSFAQSPGDVGNGTVSSCRSGYSATSFINVKNDLSDAKISEVRGSGLFYSLQIEISKEADFGERSASNTINISAVAVASETVENNMNKIANSIKARKVTAICLKPDHNSFYHNTVLAHQFILKYGELPGSYELDLVQPFPTK